MHNYLRFASATYGLASRFYALHLSFFRFACSCEITFYVIYRFITHLGDDEALWSNPGSCSNAGRSSKSNTKLMF